MRTTTAVLTGSLLALSIGLPSGARAQDLQDGRWLPYIGCWVQVDAAEGPMTCVVPEGRGVAFLTVAEQAVTERRLLSGDGTARPANVSGCTGTEASRFSNDGYRLFTAAELTCGGSDRRTLGVIAMVGSDQWMEARALDAGDGSVAWVQRYRPAPPTRVAAAGLGARVAVGGTRAADAARAAASSIGVSDVIEAQANTDPEAVKAWIAERNDPIRLDAASLTRLADAGVSPDVIDVMVAVSFPSRFAVARQDGSDKGRWDNGRWYGRGYGYSRIGMYGMWGPYGPYYYDPFYSYSRYGWGGYYGSGYYGSWGVYRPTRVVITPVRPTNPTTRGRVVKGRGYVPGSSTSRGTARPRTSPGSSSSSATVRSDGHQSSGSSSSRKAKPRNGGGGGGGL